NLLELYPNDLSLNSSLAYRYLYMEEWEKAIEHSELYISYDIQTIQPHQFLAHAHRGKGQYERAGKILEYYRDHVSNNATIHYYLCLNHICEGDYENALKFVNKALSIDPTIARFSKTKADIYHCLGDYTRAEIEAKKLLEVEDFTANSYGYRFLSHLYAFQGKFELAKKTSEKRHELSEALEEEEEGEEEYIQNRLAYLHIKNRNPEEALKTLNQTSQFYKEVDLRTVRRALYLQGIAYIMLRSLDEAQSTAENLKIWTEKDANQKAIRWYYNLMGMIELEKNNSQKALDYFHRAASTLSSPTYFRDYHGLILESMADAYFRIGDFDEAQKAYEKIISSSTIVISYGDIYVKALYMLGRISEKQGDTDKAIDHYENFLELWKDADPGLDEVDDAKKRLAGLIQ
ncbi:tetratricopeptide repeat protein, partial [Acidobacteriota bacterium]